MSENDKPKKSDPYSALIDATAAYLIAREKDQLREANREAKGRGKILSPEEQYIYEFYKENGSSPERLAALNEKIASFNAAHEIHASGTSAISNGRLKEYEEAQKNEPVYQSLLPVERAVNAFRKSLTKDQISQQPQQAAYTTPIFPVSAEEIAQAKLVIHENSKAIRRYERHQIDAPPSLPAVQKSTERELK